MAIILLVEDGAGVGREVTSLLEAAGHRVLRCGGGPTPLGACSLLRQGRCPLPDAAQLLVFACTLNLPLPGRSYRGIHLLRAYRAHPDYGRLPLALVAVAPPQDLGGRPDRGGRDVRGSGRRDAGQGPPYGWPTSPGPTGCPSTPSTTRCTTPSPPPNSSSRWLPGWNDTAAAPSTPCAGSPAGHEHVSTRRSSQAAVVGAGRAQPGGVGGRLRVMTRHPRGRQRRAGRSARTRRARRRAGSVARRGRPHGTTRDRGR